jgi:hypothetical protein
VLDLALGALVVMALLALSDWRLGLPLCAAMAVLQDVLRKLTPGEPAYFVLFTGVVFTAAAIGAVMQGKRLAPHVIPGWRTYVGLPFVLFVVLVILQAAHSYIRFGLPQMTIIGLIAYLAPVPAMVFAYQLALRSKLSGLRTWSWVYVAVAGLALSGVYLEYAGLPWRVLGEVGQGLTIYDVGTVLKAYSGFFRSSEIAAWHTAAVACLLFILLVGRRLTLPRLLMAVALVGILASLGVLTGRRKLLVVISVFLCAYAFLLLWFEMRSTRPALFAAAAGLIAYVAMVGMLEDAGESPSKRLRLDPSDRYAHYTARSEYVFRDIPDRFEQIGFRPVLWAVDRYGPLGAGLGTGSQGVQHVAAAASISRGAAEGGLGKITMELGLPGLGLVIWLLWAFTRYTRKVLEVATRFSKAHARFAYGLVAFLVANLASFAVAAQAFGDLFVLLMMGWGVGFLLALPILAARERAARQAAENLGIVAAPAT